MTDPIERLRAVGEGASRGDWHVKHAGSVDPHQLVVVGGCCESDLRFIATARNCWEELVAVAEEADYMIDSFGYEVSDELIEARDRLRAKVESLGEAQ